MDHAEPFGALRYPLHAGVTNPLRSSLTELWRTKKAGRSTWFSRRVRTTVRVKRVVRSRWRETGAGSTTSCTERKACTPTGKWWVWTNDITWSEWRTIIWLYLNRKILYFWRVYGWVSCCFVQTECCGSQNIMWDQKACHKPIIGLNHPERVFKA